jgi:hypothetical protein
VQKFGQSQIERMAVVPACGDVDGWRHNARQVFNRDLSIPFFMWAGGNSKQL